MMINDAQPFFDLLAEVTKRYTSNDSTSISYSTAQQLMESILYCINTQNSKKKSSSQSITLTTSTLKDVYRQGVEKKKEKIAKAKVLYTEIVAQFNAYNNRCYYDTIIKGMPEFFKWYDLEFNAKNHILTLDYPLYNEINGLCGIDLIYEYLKRISMEHSFLLKLSSSVVYKILQRYHHDYEELIINISKIVFQHTLGCLLIDKEPYHTTIDANALDTLTLLICKQSTDSLLLQLEKLLPQILCPHFKKGGDTYSYFASGLFDFSKELKAYATDNSLLTLFPYSKTIVQ